MSDLVGRRKGYHGKGDKNMLPFCTVPCKSNWLLSKSLIALHLTIRCFLVIVIWKNMSIMISPENSLVLMALALPKLLRTGMFAIFHLCMRSFILSWCQMVDVLEKCMLWLLLFNSCWSWGVVCCIYLTYSQLLIFISLAQPLLDLSGGMFEWSEFEANTYMSAVTDLM